jgi:branched-chain amino acid transport system ATP-binding protein
MAGLSDSEVDQILALLFRLNEGGTTIIMIEHVMRAVTQFSQRLAVLVAGRKVADGEPRAVLALPEVEEAYLGR